MNRPQPTKNGGEESASSRLSSFARSALTQQWSVLAFLIVSFIIAQATILALHVEPLQPEGALATEAGGANAAPSDSEANTDEQAGAS
ncbi:MAG TPA: hypothetical protein VLB11_09480, partial [Methyloceanibacter sp.]|nr:hypothetical protein [Methyloceanibacter sp.]